MIVVQFSAQTAPFAQRETRRFRDPKDEEWQPDGTWTGLFDIPDDDLTEFYELIETVGDDKTKVTEIDHKDEIKGHRMALYAFD